MNFFKLSKDISPRSLERNNLKELYNNKKNPKKLRLICRNTQNISMLAQQLIVCELLGLLEVTTGWCICAAIRAQSPASASHECL